MISKIIDHETIIFFSVLISRDDVSERSPHVVLLCFDCLSVCLLGQVQRTAQQSGDLWEDGRGSGAGGHQADEFHVLPGTLHLIFSRDSAESLPAAILKTKQLPPLSLPAHSHRPLLWRSPPSVSHGAQEGLCVGGVSAHPGEVHQHVRRAGWAEEHEMQREERPLCLQTVFRNMKPLIHTPVRHGRH